MTYAGRGGQPVKGWLLVPAGAAGPLPAVVLGYGNGRGLAHERLLWSAAGYAHFVMDTRGQGGSGAPGDTPDPVGSGPAPPGFVTRGIENPHDYYYRRVFTDAVRAAEAVRSHPLVDAGRVAAVGNSQGGGIALAAGALLPDLVAVVPDVPFLCAFPRAAAVSGRLPYQVISQYPGSRRGRDERVFHTLSYVDLRRRALRRLGACAGALLRGAGGRDVSAVDRLRRLERLRGGGALGGGVLLQRSRGRRALSAGCATPLA